MRTLLRIAICWLAFLAALIFSGLIGRILHLSPAVMPGNAPAQTLFLMQLIAGLVLVVGLVPVARGLAAPVAIRGLLLGSFILLALGVNGMIEARMFTHFLVNGLASTFVFYAVLAVFVGVAIGTSFGAIQTTGATQAPSGLPHRSLLAWIPRLAAVWLAWPVVYFFFGACIAPIVLPYYNAGIVSLRIPPLSSIFEVQLIRSLIFLATSLPFVALWKGSRRNLWLALGLAHAFTIGLYGLVGATFLPMALRVAHSAEITCDSFAYAGLLVLLFASPAASANINASKIDTAQLQPRPLA
jgi:hypothetical protein